MTDSHAPDRDQYDRIIRDHPAREAATILASECRAKDALVAQAQNMIRALGGNDIVTENSTATEVSMAGVGADAGNLHNPDREFIQFMGPRIPRLNLGLLFSLQTLRDNTCSCGALGVLPLMHRAGCPYVVKAREAMSMREVGR